MAANFDPMDPTDAAFAAFLNGSADFNVLKEALDKQRAQAKVAKRRADRLAALAIDRDRLDSYVRAALQGIMADPESKGNESALALFAFNTGKEAMQLVNEAFEQEEAIIEAQTRDAVLAKPEDGPGRKIDLSVTPQDRGIE